VGPARSSRPGLSAVRDWWPALRALGTRAVTGPPDRRPPPPGARNCPAPAVRVCPAGLQRQPPEVAVAPVHELRAQPPRLAEAETDPKRGKLHQPYAVWILLEHC